jgi:hypothetical protein
MRRALGFVLLLVSGTLLSGCVSLQDTRSNYIRNSLALWDDDTDFLMEWRYPSFSNLPKLEGPKRWRPELTATGTYWATGIPWQQKSEQVEPSAPDTSEAPPAQDEDLADEPNGGAPVDIVARPRDSDRVQPAR